MPLSMKTMEVQIKGDQWNKRFRTMQVYCKGEAYKMSGMEGPPHPSIPDIL